MAYHRVLFFQLGDEFFVNAFELSLSQRVAHSQHGLFNRQGLFDEVERAQLGRPHGSFHVAVAGDDHHRGVAIRIAHLAQSLKAVDSRQPNVEQHATVDAAADCFQTVFAGSDGVGSKPFVAQHSAQRFANPAFVVNDEN